jgi:transposase InsO family protein
VVDQRDQRTRLGQRSRRGQPGETRLHDHSTNASSRDHLHLDVRVHRMLTVADRALPAGSEPRSAAMTGRGLQAVLGWAMADHYRTDLIKDAIRMAAATGLLQPDAIFHADRGSNYTSDEFGRSRCAT